MSRQHVRDGPRFSTMLKYKNRDGLIPNTLAFSYIGLSFPLAMALLASNVWPLGIVWLAHTLIIAAYLLHECAHNTLFADNRDNERAGAILSWWLGSACTPYRQLRDKHFRHHVQREDILGFNAHALMEKHPALHRGLRVLTFFHVPAFEIYTHLLAAFAPFFVSGLEAHKRRVMLVLSSRIAFFGLLFLIDPWIPVMYFVAWMLFLWVLNLMDAMQHSYEISYSLLQPSQPPRFDAAYEEANTYTNLLSSRYPAINLLVLNFCYHNAHHRKPTEPWYRLPALHWACYPEACEQVIPLREQLQRFHRYRLRRLQVTSVIDDAGVDGVSFLVGV